MGYRVLADQMEDFEPRPLDESTEHAAAIVVCGKSQSVDEARMMLVMLGLLPGPDADQLTSSSQGSDSDVLSELPQG